AKIASLDVVKKVHQLRMFALPAERSILSEIDVLLGPAFRKFCEACERQDTKEVIKRAPDIRELAQRYSSSSGIKTNSTLWHLTVSRIAKHTLHLVEEGSARSRAATIPSLGLATKVFKMDLTRPHRQMALSARLVNKGEGRAINVVLEAVATTPSVELVLLDPSKSFEISGESEQIITLGLKLSAQCSSLRIPITWQCTTLDGHPHQNEDGITIQQQIVQPNWDKLLENPPYSLNPVKERSKLFGRDMVLQELLIHAA